MRLEQLLNEIDVFDRPANARKIDITSVVDRGDQVRPGSLFCCVPGSRVDGHDFAPEAVERGAAALLVERELGLGVPEVRVPDARAALGPVAAAFWDHPDRHLRVAGITGTNGKTTTTHILASILRAHGWKTATIGTLTGHYTSPPPLELHRILADLRKETHAAVVMEVSSHALVQRRVDAIRFRVGVFTNLTQDHLDYHRTMDEYFEAKASLFDPGRTDRAVVNVDDEWGRTLVDRLAMPVSPYSLADAEGLEVGPLGSTFTWEGVEVALPLIGRFNVYNALAAATAAKALGVAVDTIGVALSAVTYVPGRLERIDRGQSFTVLVDFAHTPDGLRSVLEVGRRAVEQRGGGLTVVFGCGGNRDADKRPQMGAIAAALADRVIVTTDNARDEDPATIASAVVAGADGADNVVVELDRRAAIRAAVRQAGPDDVVLIAGKGHETTQEIGGVRTPFDDRLVAAEAIDEVRPITGAATETQG